MDLSQSTHLQWRKSSRSVTGDCAEVASDGATVFVRDSKDRNGPALTFSASAWRTFVLEVKRGNPFSRHAEAARQVEP
jgi:hypothetical protein